MAQSHAPDGDAIHVEPLARGQLWLLEPLWRSLLDRIRVPDAIVPIVEHQESWPLRRAQYEALLSEGDSFGLVALRDDEPVGYAMVRVEDGPDAVWATGERYVELASLSVAPGERDRGTGTRLLDEVDDRLRALGIAALVVGVDSVNEDALRFYRRRGFSIGYHLLYGRLRGGLDSSVAGDEDPGTAAHGEA